MAMKKKNLMSWSAIAALAVVFVAVNILGNALLNSSRIDLTEGRLYTLSEGTKKIISELKEPVTLRFFYSEEQANGYPVIQSYGSRLKGLLGQFQTLSGGKVKVEFINPKAFSEEEDLAVSLGVAGLAMEGSGEKLYFGLAASNTVGDHAAIPFFDPEKAPFVEYDLTRMIHDLSSPKKPKVALMTWMPMQGGGGTMFDVQGPWVIFQQMKESFDLTVLDKDVQHIPDDTDVLMVVHPTEDIPEDTVYAIDQYILKGGRAIIFTDPYTKMDGISKPASNLPKLFHAWGVDMPEEDVVADPQSAIRVKNDERGSVLEAVSNPVWLALQKGNFNNDEIISSNLEVMRFIVSGHIVPWKPKDGEATKSEITMTPLVLSGSGTGTISSHSLIFNFDPAQFMSKAKPLSGRAVMAARLSGMAHTAFPEKKDAEHVDVSKSPINVVLVADVDMLRDGFWVTKQNYIGKEILIPTANNGSFVLNALDVLSGGGDLIGLRSRMTADRPFERVQAMRLEAEGKFREQEDELKNKLADLERRLTLLQNPDVSKGDGEEALFSPGQQEELDRFRREMLSTRKELRKVQRSLRENIESLAWKVKLINIAAVPLLVLLLALVIPARLGMRRQ